MHPSTLPPELRLRRVRVTHRWREYGFELVVPRHESPGFRSIPGVFFVPPTTSQTPLAAMLWLSRLDTEGDRSCALRSRLGARCSALSCTISAIIPQNARGALPSENPMRPRP